MSAYEFQKAKKPGPCDVVEAQFVFGPQLCLKWTEFTTEDAGETFYVCEEHIAAAGAEVPS